MLLEKLLRIACGHRLKQLKSGHDVSYYCHRSLLLYVRRQRMLHGPARFERRQNRIEIDRSAAENLVAKRVR
jgi:hypothetical protein